MNRLNRNLFGLLICVSAALAWRRKSIPDADVSPDRGDIPGWVMIAIMSAAVVVVLIPFVGPVITRAFSSAVDSVSNTGSTSGGQ